MAMIALAKRTFDGNRALSKGLSSLKAVLKVWAYRMTKEEEGSAFFMEELSKALEICTHSSRSSLTANGQNPGHLFWRSQRWVDVSEHFGDRKSKVLLAALESISDDFRNLERAFLLKAQKKGDMRPAFDWRKPIVKAFGNKFPDTPSKVISCLEADFAHRHR